MTISLSPSHSSSTPVTSPSLYSITPSEKDVKELMEKVARIEAKYKGCILLSGVGLADTLMVDRQIQQMYETVNSMLKNGYGHSVINRKLNEMITGLESNHADLERKQVYEKNRKEEWGTLTTFDAKLSNLSFPSPSSTLATSRVPRERIGLDPAFKARAKTLASQWAQDVKQNFPSTPSQTTDLSEKKPQAVVLENQTIKPPTPIEKLTADPFWAHKRSNIEERMATARLVAGSIHVIAKATTEAVAFVAKKPLKTAKDGIKKVCNSNPTTQKICGKTAEVGVAITTAIVDTGKKIIKETGLDLQARRLHASYVYTRDHSLPRRLHDEFLIDPATTRQYVRDSMTISSNVVLNMIPFRSIVKAIKNAAKLTVSVAKRGTQYGRGISSKTTYLGKSLSIYPEVGYSIADKSGFNQDLYRVDISKIVNDIYGIVKNHPPEYNPYNPHHLFSVIGETADLIERAIPDFTHIHHGDCKSLFSSLVKSNRPDIHPLQIKSGDAIKLVRELISTDFLQGLQLRYLNTPEPIALLNYHGSSSLLKSHLPGSTFSEMAQSIGSCSSNSRKLLLKDFSVASYQAGRAFGELQSRGLHFNARPSQWKLDSIVGSLMYKLEDASVYLKELKTPHRLKAFSRNGKSIVKEFIKNPGGVSYGFEDISFLNCCWAKGQPKPFGFFDLEYMNFSLNKEPMALTAREYHTFRNCFEDEGLIAGLRPSEIKPLKQAFSNGYYSEYVGTTSIAAEQFYELNSTVKTIHSLADSILGGETIDKEILYGLIQKANSSL